MCKKTIERRTTVESITWCPGGEGMFLSDSFDEFVVMVYYISFHVSGKQNVSGRQSGRQ